MSEEIVQLNEEVIKGQLKELVRGSVEETLNELSGAESDPRQPGTSKMSSAKATAVVTTATILPLHLEMSHSEFLNSADKPSRDAYPRLIRRPPTRPKPQPRDKWAASNKTYKEITTEGAKMGKWKRVKLSRKSLLAGRHSETRGSATSLTILESAAENMLESILRIQTSLLAAGVTGLSCLAFS